VPLNLNQPTTAVVPCLVHWPSMNGPLR